MRQSVTLCLIEAVRLFLTVISTHDLDSLTAHTLGKILHAAHELMSYPRPPMGRSYTHRRDPTRPPYGVEIGDEVEAEKTNDL